MGKLKWHEKKEKVTKAFNSLKEYKASSDGDIITIEEVTQSILEGTINLTQAIAMKEKISKVVNRAIGPTTFEVEMFIAPVYTGTLKQENCIWYTISIQRWLMADIEEELMEQMEAECEEA